MLLSQGEWSRTLLMISQHWFKWQLGAIRQQAITWTNLLTQSCPHVYLHHQKLSHVKGQGLQQTFLWKGEKPLKHVNYEATKQIWDEMSKVIILNDFILLDCREDFYQPITSVPYLQSCKYGIDIIGWWTSSLQSRSIKLFQMDHKSDVKCRNTLGCLDQYTCRRLRLWNNQDHKTVQVYKLYMQRMKTVKQSGPWSSLGTHGSLVGMRCQVVIYTCILWWWNQKCWLFKLNLTLKVTVNHHLKQ